MRSNEVSLARLLRAGPSGRRVWREEDRGYETPCWIWQLSCTRAGYAQRNLGAGRVVRVHVVLWEIANGPVPDGLELDHLCRQKACVNPAHLDPVTHHENLLRSPIRGGAKLSRTQREEIRRLGRSVAGSELAARFGVARSTISAVLTGQNWATDGVG